MPGVRRRDTRRAPGRDTQLPPVRSLPGGERETVMMYEFFQKWQTLIVWVLGVIGVFVMAFLYARFPTRKEFNAHKTSAQEQLSAHKTDVQKQLTAHKEEVLKQLNEVKQTFADDVRDLESQLEKMPTKEDLHELELKIEGLNTNIESVKPGLDEVKKLTHLLMENELREKRNE
jgi:hypothetical protein